MPSSYFDENSLSGIVDNRYEDIAGNPFADALGFAQGWARKIGNQAQQEASKAYAQADRSLGGWLPGGGAASPLSTWQQEQAKNQQAEKDRIRATPPYIGKPGERSNKAGISNALDALNRAGASPLGFVTENPNDMKLVKKYFTNNPDVTNQYDLPTNMFLRYYSGVGAEGMKLNIEQGKQILQGIEKSKANLNIPVEKQNYLNQFIPAVANTHNQRIETGMVPVTYTDIPAAGEIAFSLGRYWAKPSPNNSYQINESFDWGTAPKNKGGSSEKGQEMMRQDMAKTPSWAAALNGPGVFAQNLVSKGYGNPFSYELLVSPNGEVQTKPLLYNQ